MSSQPNAATLDAGLDWLEIPEPSNPAQSAKQYLTALFNQNDCVCLTFIHGTKTYRSGGAVTENRFLPLSEVITEAELKRLHERNKFEHIYVSMAPFKLGSKNRTKTNISEVRHVFMDADENGDAVLAAVHTAVAKGEIPSPTIIVRSSPHKFQFVWNVTGFTIPQQEALNRTLQQKFGTDAQAVDAARVLRIPGFRNIKPKYGDPKPVAEIVEYNEPPSSGISIGDFKIPMTSEPDSTIYPAASDAVVQQSIECLESAMEAASVSYTRKPWDGSGGAYKFLLALCPWRESHENGGESDAIAIVQPSGAYGFKCLHNHCSNRGWNDFRAHLESLAGRRLPFTSNGKPKAAPTEASTAVGSTTNSIVAAPYPEFPYWVMKDTSIYTGLVEPECRVNCKYEEFLFMAAFVHLLNYVMIRVRIERRTQTTGILLVNIGERGKALKSASCDLAFDYMFRAGLGKKFNKSLTRDDLKDRSLIVTAGSPEGFLGKMTSLGCSHGILYYDELSKLVSKASIESSSMVPDLCTMLESGEFSSITLKNSPVLNAGEYCVSVIANTPSKRFLHVWAQLHGNESTGLEDRAFLLLEPPTKKDQTGKIDVPFSFEALKTTGLRVNAAIERAIFPAGDWRLFDEAIKHLGIRAEVRAEIFALGFAIDLGRDHIDDDCKRRGIALAEYDLATKHYLRPIEAETKQGAIQQEIVRTVEQAGGQMPYRELCQAMNYQRIGSDVWDRAMLGLEHGMMPLLRRVKGTPGRNGSSTMIYLIPEDELNA